MPAATDRRVFGGLRRTAQPLTNRPVGSQPVNEISFEPTSPAEERFRAAADRVARGWSQPVQGRVDRRDSGSQVALVWRSSDVNRAVAMRYENSGQISLSGAATIADPNAPRDHASSIQRGLRVWADLPDENDLTLSLRMAMEEVERWNPTPAPYSS
jgi:hypothetical protein